MVQQILSHQSIKTTVAYLHPDHRHLADAAKQANRFVSKRAPAKEGTRCDGPLLRPHIHLVPIARRGPERRYARKLVHLKSTYWSSQDLRSVHRPGFCAVFFHCKDSVMSNKFPLEVRERATWMALDRLPDYPSPWAACRDLGEKLNVGAETLGKWVRQAQVPGQSPDRAVSSWRRSAG